MRKHAEFVLVHVAIGSAYGVKFSTAAWVTTVTDCRGSSAGSKGFREKNTTLVKIEVFVGNMEA
jgi:hypothetical protein